MTRPVRVATAVEEDIDRQLERGRVDEFWSRDLMAAIEMLEDGSLWDGLPTHGAGRRLTVEGLSVGAFHLFVAADDLDARPDALVIYAVDIWPNGFH